MLLQAGPADSLGRGIGGARALAVILDPANLLGVLVDPGELIRVRSIGDGPADLVLEIAALVVGVDDQVVEHLLHAVVEVDLEELPGLLLGQLQTVLFGDGLQVLQLDCEELVLGDLRSDQEVRPVDVLGLLEGQVGRGLRLRRRHSRWRLRRQLPVRAVVVHRGVRHPELG